MCAKYVVIYKMWLLLGFIWLMVLCNSISQVDGRPQEGDNVAQDDHAHQGTSYFQGDIILSEDDVLWLDGNRPEADDAITNPKRMWEKKGTEVLIPYEYDPAYNFPSNERKQIDQAIEKFNQKTCIRFKQANMAKYKNWVNIRKGTGCSSYIGRNTTFPGQDLSLDDGCFDKNKIGRILHELMHVIGFWHEHARTDRHKYVTIDEHNVKKAWNFEKITPSSSIQDLGLPYDFDSVMHYPPKAFAIDNSKPTISAINPAERMFGQRDRLSELDERGVNLLYDCTAELNRNPAPTDCKDTHRLCHYWASTGECYNKFSYMSDFCRASCKQCGCPAGSYKTKGSLQCFKYFLYKTTSRTWTEARDFCKGKGWKLATPNDDVNLEELSKHLVGKAGGWNKSVWLGARGSDCGFLWEADVCDQPPRSRRSKLDKSHPGWRSSRWASGQLRALAGKDYCLSMSPHQDKPSRPYGSSLCSVKKATLCEL